MNWLQISTKNVVTYHFANCKNRIRHVYIKCHVPTNSHYINSNILMFVCGICVFKESLLGIVLKMDTCGSNFENCNFEWPLFLQMNHWDEILSQYIFVSCIIHKHTFVNPFYFVSNFKVFAHKSFICRKTCY